MTSQDHGTWIRGRPRVTNAFLVAFSVLSWLAFFAWLPSAIGRGGRKVGWRDGRPTALNWLGTVPFALGAAGLGWCLAAHVAPGETMPLSLVPETLITRGPYRFSRNPMYVCELSIWTGWTLYYGSPGLLAVVSVLGAGMRYAVSREERTLASRFGDSWREYASKVPRWI